MIKISLVTFDQRYNFISGTVKSTNFIWMKCFPPAPLCLQWEKGVMIGFIIISVARLLYQSACDISQERAEWKTRESLNRLILLKVTLISSGCSRPWEIAFFLQSALWAHCRHPQIAHHLSSALYSRQNTPLYSSHLLFSTWLFIMSVYLYSEGPYEDP